MRRLLILPFLAALIGFASPAFAQSCGDELQKLSKQREAALQTINGMVAASKGKQLDPAVFCARSAPLNSAENAMLAYMIKNKDWCQIPDEAIAQLKATHARTASFSGKACNVAAQIKKMKEQAAQGAANGAPQAQPLPAGPL